MPAGGDPSGLYPISVLDPEAAFAVSDLRYLEPLATWLQASGWRRGRRPPLPPLPPSAKRCMPCRAPQAPTLTLLSLAACALRQGQGYSPGVTLFGCGYDFRQSTRDSAQALLARLQVRCAV